MRSQSSVIVALTLMVNISMIHAKIFLDEGKHCQPAETSSAKMGHIISNIHDVKELSPERADHIKSMLLQHGVVVIEKQNLTRQEQVDFTSKLGDIVVLPQSLEGNDPEVGFPEIQRSTNYWYNGTWKGPRNCFGCGWHKDGDFQHNGYLASVMYADKVAENRSATLFLDNCEVHGKLTKMTRKALSESVFTVSVRNIPDFSKGKEEDYALFPFIKRHEGIYRHPENGRTCAYITNTLLTENGYADHLRGAWAEITGFSEKYIHYWKKGDIVIWDNLAVMHRAGFKLVSGPNQKTPRMLYRTQAFL